MANPYAQARYDTAARFAAERNLQQASANGTLTPEQGSARTILSATLASYGLGALADRAWQMYLEGKPIEQIMLELRNTDEYRNRFPGMAALSKKGRAISEAEYMQLESTYVSLFRQAGLPAGFYDQSSDFASFIGNEVSPVELSARLDEYKRITYELPPIVRAELGRQYGLTAGDITAYIIDPTRALPILHNQVLAAQSGAAARQAGFGLLTRGEAEQLAQFGVDFGSALQGFGQLTNMQQLFTPLVGDQGETGVTREQQLGAAFGGDALAAQKIANVARRRVATFEEGGRYGSFGTAET